MADQGTIKQGDFVEISFTGTIADTGAVFDTTEEAVAKEQGLSYSPGELGRKIICVGAGHILKGLDHQLLGMAVGGKKQVTLKPEEAFGKKDASLVRLIPTNHFRKEGINPTPGMQISVDGALGVVKTISGARTLVDLNNPLAGHDVSYRLDVISKVEDIALQAAWTINNEMGFLPDVKVNGDSKDALTIILPPKFPKALAKSVTERVQKSLPQITSVTVEESPKKGNNKV